ncbi:TIGR02466 family protein [Archangium lansingense]|uniref:TIGR02466 family protein n=1 Tax=Archangium lansingense TaxID=2995310 RepID=A0ABT4AJG4_9BACT|nr:TIGR02466 family protein [Archangium lansinium]MCY1081842.1 TIGR02466 family protein [Archangium lansinium]
MPSRSRRAAPRRVRAREESPPTLHSRDDLRLLWATPIFIRRLAPPPPWNAALERRIRERQASDPGRQRSNYGGWQSSDDLFESDVHGGELAPEFQELRALIHRALLDCLSAVMPEGAVTRLRTQLSAFANVLPRGGYHTHHVHPGSHLAGSYYVNAGRPDPGNPHSGKLCFYEPRAGGAMLHSRLLGFAEDFDVLPETGMLVLFPGYLGHSVHPYTGPGARITVAFNAYLQESKT